jgi:hypothetical protein
MARPHSKSVSPGIPPRKDTECRFGNTKSASLACAFGACNKTPRPPRTETALALHVTLNVFFIVFFFTVFSRLKKKYCQQNLDKVTIPLTTGGL